MPIYEYVCENCENYFEELVRGDDAPTACPHCGSDAIHRKISMTASPHAAEASCAARDAGLCSPESPAPCGCSCGCSCGHRH